MDLTTLSSLRADRTLKTVEKINAIYFVERPFRHFVRVLTFKTVVKCKFLGWPSDGFVTSRASDAQNCGKMQILGLGERLFHHFVRVGHSNLW